VVTIPTNDEEKGGNSLEPPDTLLCKAQLSLAQRGDGQSMVGIIPTFAIIMNCRECDADAGGDSIDHRVIAYNG
jgi:hypothetical protein